MADDWQYQPLPNAWHHPQTNVTVYDEDMPDELRP